MNREYHKWYSTRLERDMELLVFGHAGARVLVLPARMGRFYDYEKWGMVDVLQKSILQGNLQLFCVDSIDSESLYNQDVSPEYRILRHMAYESYLLEEVLPFTAIANPNPFLISHGCSLGAYHAVNIAFRHPHLFGKVVALSGRYDLTISIAHYRDLFDGYYDQNIYYHNPSHFLPNLDESEILHTLQKMEIIMAIGVDDPFYPNNKAFSDVLTRKGIPHALHCWDGEAHRPRYWRQMIGHYL